jgi:hypothetical protein
MLACSHYFKDKIFLYTWSACTVILLFMLPQACANMLNHWLRWISWTFCFGWTELWSSQSLPSKELRLFSLSHHVQHL